LRDQSVYSLRKDLILKTCSSIHSLQRSPNVNGWFLIMLKKIIYQR